MIIGVLQFEIAIHHAVSLKDKRRVIQSLKDRLHREHQVAVAEVAKLDQPTRGVLGLSMVSNEIAHAQSVLDRLIDKLQAHPDFELMDHNKQLLTGH